MTDKTDIELMQQALEALIENARLLGITQAKRGYGFYSQVDAIFERAFHECIAKHSAVLRERLAQPDPLQRFTDVQQEIEAALAQPEQEQVAVIKRNEAGQITMQTPDGNPFDMSKYIGAKLHTAPPEQERREWQGLTEQERLTIENECETMVGKPVFDAIEAKLKEKNT